VEDILIENMNGSTGRKTGDTSIGKFGEDRVRVTVKD
jgi:hypothetical protein